MNVVLNQISDEAKAILKRNNAKNLIKFADAEYDKARKLGLKTNDHSYLNNNQDYIRAFALEISYDILERNEDIQHYLDRPTTIMWLNGFDFQKKIINLAIEIVTEARKQYA